MAYMASSRRQCGRLAPCRNVIGERGWSGSLGVDWSWGEWGSDIGCRVERRFVRRGTGILAGGIWFW